MTEGRHRARFQPASSPPALALALAVALAAVACLVAAPAYATIAYEKSSGSFH